MENRNSEARQLTSTAYPLSGVQVVIETLVKRIIIETRDGMQAAIGVQLINDRIHLASKEVIVSAGGYRSPQLLTLSGIGPVTELVKHGITQTLDAPCVDENLHDQMAVSRW